MELSHSISFFLNHSAIVHITSIYGHKNIRYKYTRIYVRISANDATSAMRKHLWIKIHYRDLCVQEVRI